MFFSFFLWLVCVSFCSSGHQPLIKKPPKINTKHNSLITTPTLSRTTDPTSDDSCYYLNSSHPLPTGSYSFILASFFFYSKTIRTLLLLLKEKKRYILFCYYGRTTDASLITPLPPDQRDYLWRTHLSSVTVTHARTQKSNGDPPKEIERKHTQKKKLCWRSTDWHNQVSYR